MIKVGSFVVYLRGSLTRDNLANTFGNRDIWKVRQLQGNRIEVESITSSSEGAKSFISLADRFHAITEVRQLGLFERKYFKDEAYDTYYTMLDGIKVRSNPTKDYKQMNSNNSNTVIDRTIESNADAAKVAAKITLGNTLNRVVSKKVTPQLPMLARGYADTAIGRIAIANLADFAVKQFLPNNEKAVLATEAMMQAAMLELLSTFDLESIVNEILANVTVDTEAS